MNLDTQPGSAQGLCTVIIILASEMIQHHGAHMPDSHVKKRVWSNSRKAFVLHTQQQGA